MAVNIAELIEKIRTGKYSNQQLLNIRKNAESKGFTEVMSVCDEILAQSAKVQSTGRRGSKNDRVVDSREGFVIMQSAYDDDSNLINPELIKVAQELSTNPNVTDISIRKTQVVLYYKGRHLTSGQRPKKEVFWVSCLDETKITDTTVEGWRQLGEVYRAKYFNTHYVGVNVDELNKLHAVLSYIGFT
ncbi:hypothetical protein L3Q72_17780 [Vibrio sp. JC009]|uniref:hypothetical protein n=1 Tax=Vibrio sp. JC009 TaxID=2912314 RepID=UPI0023AF7B61|nr:hypothetical protein [Vibrio sp. JC009]WED24726.1 hypothetical protein L3Q72_17780 [Vibrio sp. JC009]